MNHNGKSIKQIMSKLIMCTTSHLCWPWWLISPATIWSLNGSCNYYNLHLIESDLIDAWFHSITHVVCILVDMLIKTYQSSSWSSYSGTVFRKILPLDALCTCRGYMATKEVMRLPMEPMLWWAQVHQDWLLWCQPCAECSTSHLPSGYTMCHTTNP